MPTFISHGTQETIFFAKQIAKQLKKGDILVLSGELGAGKTKFTEGLLSYFGLENEISSPTFTIVNEYDTKPVPLYHFDVYRLNDPDEFYAIGGEEYFQKGICVIEWGEQIESVLPPNYISITFSKEEQDESVRYLDFTFHGNSTICLSDLKKKG